MKFPKIKNILFDFGRVLYDIDPMLTFKGYATLSPFLSNLGFNKASELIKDDIWRFETGSIESQIFRNAVKQKFQFEIDDDQFDMIWNKTLIGMVPNCENIVSLLSQKYRIALLSNTNIIHYIRFSEECRSMFSHFEKTFFSFEIGMCKPDIQIFEYTFNKLGFVPENTLFIDDLKINLKAASSLGSKIFQIKPNQTLKDISNFV